MTDILATALMQLPSVPDEPAPNPTPRRTRSRAIRKPHRRSTEEDEGLEVPGRLGASLLTGKAIDVYKDFSPSIFSFPPEIPIDEEISVWGRRWIVKDTSLPRCSGKGVFACEDIHVELPLARGEDGPHLFPYIGSVYTGRAWKTLVAQHPSWRVYQLDMDTFPECMKRPTHARIIDGDPVRCGNIAGYINSVQGGKGKSLNIEPNVEWVQFAGSPSLEYCLKNMDDHIMTVATRTIRAGEELLCDYEWGA